MSHRALGGAAAATVAVVLAAAGCGGSDDKSPALARATTAPASTTPATTTPGGGTAAGDNKRQTALACIRGKGVNAVPAGEKSIAVEGPRGPRIDFFQSSLEAEGQQFEGKAEGAEQIGAALLFVRGGSDKLLNDLELCLNEQ